MESCFSEGASSWFADPTLFALLPGRLDRTRLLAYAYELVSRTDFMRRGRTGIQLMMRPMLISRTVQMKSGDTHQLTSLRCERCMIRTTRPAIPAPHALLIMLVRLMNSYGAGGLQKTCGENSKNTQLPPGVQMQIPHCQTRNCQDIQVAHDISGARY